MSLRRTSLVLAAALWGAACGDENPVGIGGLLPQDPVRTAEIVLDATRFLEWDSVRTGFDGTGTAPYLMVAEDFQGALDSHILLRFGALPEKVDTLPILDRGSVVLKVDTARNRLTAPVTLALYRTAEAWDPSTVTWDNRVDSLTAKHPWTEPGGTRGPLVSTVNVHPGDTTVTFAVDSVTLRMWKNKDDGARGALIVAETPGARLRFATSATLRASGRTTAQPDSIITDSTSVVQSTFVYSPAATQVDGFMAGGAPSWRTYLRLKQRIDTLQVPCPGGPEGCTTRLGSVSLNFAGLQLQPLTPQAGFLPEDTVRIEIRPVVAIQNAPIARAMIGVGATGATIPASRFADGADRVEVPVTPLLQSLVTVDTATVADRSPPTLVLLDGSQGGRFGISTFGSTQSGDAAPVLRIIYSVINEEQLR